MSRDAPWRTARKMFALHQGRNDWYRVRNQADGPTQVYIYDEIGYFSVSANDFVRDLAEIDGPIELHISSPGGEVYDGITIYNALLGRKPRPTVIIDGIAASIASVIACAGSPTLIAKSGTMMIHDGFTMAIGSASDLREMADRLDRASNTIASIYAERTGKPEAYWRQLMKKETWYSGAEAIDSGLADGMIEVGSGDGKASDGWDLSVFHNAASVPYVGTREHRHIPMTGRHSHDHSAFGASDHDDGAHLHTHEHANDADHNHDHSQVMDGDGDADSAVSGMGSWALNATMIAKLLNAGGTRHNHEHVAHTGPDGDGDGSHAHTHFHPPDVNHSADDHDHSHPPSLPIEGSLPSWLTPAMMADVLNWDGAAAFASCKTAADFRKVCAGERSSGDPDTKAHWALPHHTSPGAGPDKGGVVAALGRWDQTQGLKNKDAALSHLKAHASALGLPSGDEDGGSNSLVTDEDVQTFIQTLKGSVS